MYNFHLTFKLTIDITDEKNNPIYLDGEREMGPNQQRDRAQLTCSLETLPF